MCHDRSTTYDCKTMILRYKNHSTTFHTIARHFW